ncbi:hypothetical protein SPF06_13315 [Sinomonas sp. JGH33]|uniref:Uncharacterized protein n=1 Tax=Sinomonas terricola TaxID=3110330 RepID=A0ABU5T7S2_9MICC|nr:hypothetical protein [Sinomonas sp. JGH33]MEA5455707.1 hypothetical protein [Sinomonas sp. JGH33]
MAEQLPDDGLTLGRPDPAGAPAAPLESRLYRAPELGEVAQLSARGAVVRLNPRQSAIGSLFVTGSRGAAWEDVSRVSGAQSVHREQIGTVVPTAGGRPLVGYVNRDAVVVLRHVRLLRRALFIAGGGPLAVQTFDGSATAVASSLGEGQRTVLTLLRIGSMLELRAESVPHEWDDGQIWREFGFSMTIGLGRR